MENINELEAKLKILNDQQALEIIQAQKNRGFTQIYQLGWERLREIIQKNPRAAMLYSFLAEHIDSNCGAVVCDQKFLADKLVVSVRTIQRWLDYLEDTGALVRIPVSGRICAYALNPHEVWKGYNTKKEYAAFVTKTLVNKDGAIQRRIQAMFRPDQEEPAEPAEPPGWKDPDTPDMFDEHEPEGTEGNETAYW